MREPAPRQLDVLRFIADHLDREGFPPSLREITDHLGAKSTMTATTHVEALIRKGLLERRATRARALRITPLGAAALAR